MLVLLKKEIHDTTDEGVILQFDANCIKFQKENWFMVNESQQF